MFDDLPANERPVRSIVFTGSDMFSLHCRALVNPVNCVGVMGKGLALEFKNKFPKNFDKYKKACDSQNLNPGEILRVKEEGVIVYNFPTKVHWKDPSEMHYITKGLKALVEKLNKDEPETVAVPALGCGLGGLSWDKVKFEILAAIKTGLTYDYKTIYVCKPF